MGEGLVTWHRWRHSSRVNLFNPVFRFIFVYFFSLFSLSPTAIMINYGFHARYYERPEVTWYLAESNYDLARLFFFSFSPPFHLSGSRFSLNFVGGVFIVRHLRCQALNVDDKHWRQVVKEYSKRHAENEIYRINLFCLFEEGEWNMMIRNALFLQNERALSISYFKYYYAASHKM